MARTRKTPEVTVPTVTDEQYQELLSIRLAAMHGFADGTVDEPTMKAARAAVRKARKIRRTEEGNGVLPTYREHLQKLAAEKEAAAKARTRKPRAKKQTVTQSAPDTEPVSENEPSPEVENDTPAEIAA